ncbi:DUF1963 domain-containing protein [Streptomyces chattanoogensis]|uniref:DUF1963 domain-containing protein n=1 Tax=Streptomyces chattanoogensis TaxID=66876 RepID=UPI0036CD06C9
MARATPMARTTPPRPVAVEGLFPEVAAYRRDAVRLHPRHGVPGPRDSSLGGPLLWPSSEPWPHCDDDHPRTAFAPPQPGVIPMVPVLQLFAADVPELPFPHGTDVLHVLWCPFDHEPGYVPRPVLYWRDSSECDSTDASVYGSGHDSVGDDNAAAPPRPDGAADDYLPNPCVLHPERVTDYPNWDLPDEIADALEERFDQLEEETGWSYWSHLSVSEGIKVGGYPTWTQEPVWPNCPDCGRRMDHLLTINSREFNGESWRTWLPLEDTPATGTVWDLPYEERTRIQCPPGLTLGDMGGIYLFDCRRCPERPYAYHSDCS